MTRIRRTSLDDPAASRPIPRGMGALAQVGPLAIGRARLEPGWRWSEDIKPVAGTEWCQAHHLHVLVSGRFAVEMDDGEAAEFAPGDVFDVPPGHDAWVVGDELAELLDVSGNVADFGLPREQARIVVTMLMSDIVESTATVARIGDGPWRQTLADHDRLVRSLIARFRGHEMSTTGDGFFVTFDSAAAAIRCAQAMRDAVEQVGLQLRIGVHTGEIERSHDDVRGIAVHATARVMAAASPSEILVSAVTRVLAEGGELRFSERGPHSLKGIPAPMELYAAE